MGHAQQHWSDLSYHADKQAEGTESWCETVRFAGGATCEVKSARGYLRAVVTGGIGGGAPQRVFALRQDRFKRRWHYHADTADACAKARAIVRDLELGVSPVIDTLLFHGLTP